MIIKHSFYNILGLGLPLGVAVVAIPALIQSLGLEQFGILTIIWAVVSYFGLFDLGLGRAVTQQVAAAVASGDAIRLKGVVGTSTALMGALGIVGGFVLLAAAPLLASALTQASDPDAVSGAFRWMALAMPAIILTSGYRGILEALGRFGLINAIRLPMGVFTYAGPLVVVWSGYGDLRTIAAVLCAGRIAACGLHAAYAMHYLPSKTRAGSIDRALISPLLSMGGWITVSNVVSPIMNYVDRFLIGVAVSAPAVAYYATPQELVLRIGIIPTAVAAVLFPIFASGATGQRAGAQPDGVARYSALIFVLLAPVTAALLLFGHSLLAVWISPRFADEAVVPLQIMSVAALCSGLAQVPFSMLQARGRADLTAKIHIVELPLYLVVLYTLVLEYGIVGAAFAWLLRIAVDMLAMYWLCSKAMRSSIEPAPVPAGGGP